MISSQALIKKFQLALSEKWGYIWGTSGERWMAAKQKDPEKGLRERRDSCMV